MNCFSNDLAQTGWQMHRVHQEPPSQFQVLGERACGTNVVRKLIEKAWQIDRTEGLGWKHAAPGMVAIPKRMLVVCVQRSALSWAQSLYKRPWHAHPTLQAAPFSTFIRSEWNSIVDRTSDFDMIHPETHVDGQPLQLDRHPITGKLFETIFAMRTVKSAALLGMRNRGCDVAYVQLEAVQRDPEAFVTALGQAFDLPPTDTGYRPVTRRLGTRFNPSVPSRPEAPDVWSDEDRAFALSQLTPDIEASWGYSYDQSTAPEADAHPAVNPAMPCRTGPRSNF